MEGKTYGYVRVSTQVQNEARQLTAMREFGVPEENIIIEKQTGKDFRRPRYQSLVLQILSYVAQAERENIRQRQAEGIAAARERGGLLGRERIELPEDFQDLAELWQEGGISSRNAARELGISYQTFLRRAKEHCAL